MFKEYFNKIGIPEETIGNKIEFFSKNINLNTKLKFVLTYRCKKLQSNAEAIRHKFTSIVIARICEFVSIVIANEH